MNKMCLSETERNGEFPILKENAIFAYYFQYYALLKFIPHILIMVSIILYTIKITLVKAAFSYHELTTDTYVVRH